MKLIGSPRSPYVRKVRVVMLEKRIACEFVTERAALAGQNPLAKVPTLLRDSGKALYDSAVIVEYFDQLGSGPRLIPQDFESRIEVLRLQALGDGIADAIVSLTHDERYKRPDCDPKAEWYQKQLLKIERSLAVLQQDLGERSFCLGQSFSLGDAAAGMALGYLDQSYAAYPWRDKFPALKAYAARLFERPSFQQTLPS